MKVLSLRLSDELAEWFNAARGDVAWQRWIARACEERLGAVERALEGTSNGGRDRDTPGRPPGENPVPAEQFEHLREQLGTERDRDVYDKAATRLGRRTVDSSQAKQKWAG